MASLRLPYWFIENSIYCDTIQIIKGILKIPLKVLLNLFCYATPLIRCINLSFNELKINQEERSSLVDRKLLFVRYNYA